MEVLSISSLKGGVGKTTVTLGLASAAFARGLSTLVVDLDPQADATLGLGVTFSPDQPSAADVLATSNKQKIQQAIVPSAWSIGKSTTLDVVPASSHLISFDQPNPSSKRLWRLENALSSIEDRYEVVFIDTPPSLNALTRTAWISSDRVAIVTEPSLFAATAAVRGLKAVDEIRETFSQRLQPLGVIVNRIRPRSLEHVHRLDELNELFGDKVLAPTLPELPSLQQAQGAGQPIHAWPLESAQATAEKFDALLDLFFESVK